MAQKIKITEEQLKGVVNLITEQEYDEAFTKYQKEKNSEVSMSKDDARFILTLAENWCEGRVSHPDCEELDELAKKFKL